MTPKFCFFSSCNMDKILSVVLFEKLRWAPPKNVVIWLNVHVYIWAICIVSLYTLQRKDVFYYVTHLSLQLTLKIGSNLPWVGLFLSIDYKINPGFESICIPFRQWSEMNPIPWIRFKVIRQTCLWWISCA